MTRMTKKKAVPSKPPVIPWASLEAIKKDHGHPVRQGVEIVMRLEVRYPSDWMDVDEILEKANEVGTAEITKVVPL